MARLYYQPSQYYIPTLSANCQNKQLFAIHGPLNGQAQPSAGVASGFSGGVDSMYTVMTHGADAPWPPTEPFGGVQLRRLPQSG